MSKNIIYELTQEERNKNQNIQTIDISALLSSAAENVDIEYLSNSSLKNVAEDIVIAFQDLNLSTSQISELCEKLIEYRLVDQIHMLHKGKHIRWLRIPTQETVHTINKSSLTNGGIVVDIKFLDNGIYILCKNGFRFIQIRFDDCLIFQKMSTDELLVLNCCDILRKKST